jgi:hypothetical protein
MFGKRKPKDQPQQSAPGATDSGFGARGVGNLGTVIVPRSAFAQATQGGNPHELVQAVVNFVNAMTGPGIYSRFEIHPKAMQAYHADFYLAQVNNGGHSQFIHNCHGNLPYVATDVRAGLAGMKAETQLSIFEQMTAWIAQNPEEVSKQTGFQGGRAAPLDELDKAFYAAEESAPMIPANALWIASWPELRPVDDADYEEAIRRVIAMNPLREARLITRAVDNLRRQMTDWFNVGVGLACTNAAKLEMKFAIGGGSMMDVEGEAQMAFVVRTSTAVRFCVVDKAHAALYERIEADNPPMPDVGDVEGMREAIRDGRLARFKAPSVGARLSNVNAKMIAGVVELATEYGSPVALDLLLRKANIAVEDAHVAPLSIEPRSTGPVVNWVVDAGGQALFAMSLANGSALLRPADNSHLASVTKAEIDAHAARVETGEIKVP